jgi:hypothetical protein
MRELLASIRHGKDYALWPAGKLSWKHGRRIGAAGLALAAAFTMNTFFAPTASATGGRGWTGAAGVGPYATGYLGYDNSCQPNWTCDAAHVTWIVRLQVFSFTTTYFDEACVGAGANINLDYGYGEAGDWSASRWVSPVSAEDFPDNVCDG